VKFGLLVTFGGPGIRTPLRLTFMSFTLPFLTALLIHVNTASANPE
jgi:hypothetical protein